LIKLEFQQDCHESKTSKFATNVLLTLDLSSKILPTDTLLELVTAAFLDTYNAMTIFDAKVYDPHARQVEYTDTTMVVNMTGAKASPSSETIIMLYLAGLCRNCNEKMNLFDPEDVVLQGAAAIIASYKQPNIVFAQSTTERESVMELQPLICSIKNLLCFSKTLIL
jgi:hypothetical protein